MGYKKNHCIVFSVKYPIISDINVNNQNPLKLSFEAVIITRICEPLVQNAIFIPSLTHYTLLLNPLIFVKMIWKNSALFFVYKTI